MIAAQTQIPWYCLVACRHFAQCAAYCPDEPPVVVVRWVLGGAAVLVAGVVLWLAWRGED